MNDSAGGLLRFFHQRRGPLHVESEYGWRPLQVLVVFRVLVAVAFLWIAFTAETQQVLASSRPDLFLWAALLYALFASAAYLGNRLRWPTLPLQVHGQVVFDILLITTLMHASSGVTSGLGMLLVVSIAGGSILMAGRAAGFYAALASLALLLQQFAAFHDPLLQQLHLAHAGMLGVAYFATALLAQTLGFKVRENEALAASRKQELERMLRLAGFVVQRLETGILAVNAEGRVELFNSAAQRLLGLPDDAAGKVLGSLSPRLELLRQGWLAGEAREQVTLPESGESPALTVRYVDLGDLPGVGLALLQFEDTSTAMRQANQIKLASLGRLTGSIAHEIRNPLAAISHAADLLAESPGLPQEDLRLSGIISKQTRRIDQIIRNILQLGGRDKVQGELLRLDQWMENFFAEFVAARGHAAGDVALVLDPEPLQGWFNSSHLYQVLWNLCLNAERHAAGCAEPPCWRLQLTRGEGGKRPVIEVIDRGPGVPEQDRPFIFEPFFTTSSSGVGLGLYIARELAEYNRALLDYLPAPEGGSLFRLTLSPE